MQIVNICMQVLFWLTPIVWDFNIMGEAVQKILKLNPVYYVVQGYRDAFVYKEFFWENWHKLLRGAALILLLLGRVIFRKMQAHFADVL